MPATWRFGDFSCINDNLSTVFNHAQLTGGEAWFNQLDKITVPVLVIHGTEDPVLNFGNALALVEKIPGAQLLRLDGVGHEHSQE